MGRAVRASSNSLEVQSAPRKSRLDERSTKKYKKRKRRGELNDIHRKIVKTGGSLDAEKKETKAAKEKASKAQAPAKISSRILPRPSGIYRNGARGKEIRKAQKNLSTKDLDEARLVSDVFKLVNAEESARQYVRPDEKPITISDDSGTENTLPVLPITNKAEISPILGKMDRRNREFLTSKKALIQKENSDSEDAEKTPESRHQQLCSSIVSRNYAEENGLADVVPDSLGVVKATIRNIYASTFASTHLQQKIREGINLEDPEIPALRTSSSTDDCYFTWKTWRTPESSEVLPRCSQVDNVTPLNAADPRNQYDNRQSDSALEPSGDLESDSVEKAQAKFLDFFKKNNQCDQVPVKKAQVKRRGNSSRQDPTVTETIREVKAGKPLIYQEEAKDKSQQLLMNRTVSKGRAKTVLFRSSESEKLRRARNPSVQHVPTILRRNKILQTLKSNQSSVKTRSRSVKEARVFEEAPEERYLARQESFIPDQTLHMHTVETPSIINEMHKGRRRNQDSFLTLSYESILSRDSSRNYQPVRAISKPETITASTAQHQQDVVYISRKNWLRNCSHTSDTYQVQPKQQIPREVYIQQAAYPSNCPRAHQCQADANPCGRLCTEEIVQRKCQKERKMCEDEHCEHCILRAYKEDRCSTDKSVEYSKEQKPSSHVARRFLRENLPEAGILDGVGKLQILNDEWEAARINRHGNRPCNSALLFTDSTQPVKYLACEDSSETRRIPIYPREATCVAESGSPKRTHPTCVKVNQGYMLVPACKKGGKVVYVKPAGLHCSDFVHDDCPCARKIVYEDDSRKHARRERNNECDGAYALMDGQVKQLLTEDWTELSCSQKFSKIPR